MKKTTLGLPRWLYLTLFIVVSLIIGLSSLYVINFLSIWWYDGPQSSFIFLNSSSFLIFVNMISYRALLHRKYIHFSTLFSSRSWTLPSIIFLIKNDHLLSDSFPYIFLLFILQWFISNRFRDHLASHTSHHRPESSRRFVLSSIFIEFLLTFQVLLSSLKRYTCLLPPLIHFESWHEVIFWMADLFLLKFRRLQLTLMVIPIYYFTKFFNLNLYYLHDNIDGICLTFTLKLLTWCKILKSWTRKRMFRKMTENWAKISIIIRIKISEII